MRINHATFK